jgi:hypothetical protein
MHILYNSNASICVNHEYICHKLTPNFAEVGILKTSAASDFTYNESPSECTYFHLVCHPDDDLGG